MLVFCIFGCVLFYSVAFAGEVDLFLTLQNSFSYLKDDTRSEMFCFPTGNHSEEYEFVRTEDVGQGEELPSSSFQISVEDPANYRALFTYKQDGHTRFGVYSCQSERDNVTNKVVAFKTADSDVEEIAADNPYISCNVGDEVQLNATIKIPRDLAIIWLHNGVEIDEWKNKTLVTIDSATEGDVGIYECFNEGRRQMGLHALFHLIVRGCPSGKWGASCTNNCPPCYNGGICHPKLGLCVCPPNFNGTNCETSCEENYFGEFCQNKCEFESDDDDDDEEDQIWVHLCATYVFCLPEPYGCSCAAGFMGPLCEKDCKAGTFGADCKQECHCAGTCNPINGNCSHGCLDGWTGQSCQIPVEVDNATSSEMECPLNRFNYPACDKDCHCNDTCHPETGECTAGCKERWQGTTCSECRPQYYGIDCSSICSCMNGGRCDPFNGSCECVGKWKGPVCNETAPEIVTMESVEVNKGANFTLICNVSGLSNVTIWSLEIPDIETHVLQVNETFQQASASFRVDKLSNFTCNASNEYGNTSIELSISVIEPPALISQPSVVILSGRELAVNWDPWKFGHDHGGKSGDVIEYRVELEKSDDPKWLHETNWTEQMHGIRVQGVEPDTEYKVMVRCRRPGGEGQLSPPTVIRTNCSLPANTSIWPKHMIVEDVTATHAMVNWRKPEHSQIGCSPQKYVLSYWLKNNSTVEELDLKVDDESQALELQPGSNYIVKMSVFADNQLVGKPAQFEFSTHKFATGPIEIAQKSFGSRFVELEWYEPPDLVTAIDKYRVTWQLIQRGNCNDTNKTIEEIGTENTEVNLTALYPNSQYMVIIHPVTHIGPGEDLVENITTGEDEPESAPLNVRRTEANEFLWDEIPCHLINGKFLHYEYATLNATLVNTLNWEVTPTSILDRSVILTNVSEDDEFIVRGVTKAGKGPWSVGIVVNKSSPIEISAQHVGKQNHPPRELSLVKSTSTSLEVSWEAPLEGHDIIDYQVNSHLTNQTNLSSQQKTEHLTAVVSGLIPNSTYEISVIAFYSDGESQPISEIFNTDPIVEQIVSGDFKSVECSSGSRDAHLKWENSATEIEEFQVTFELVQQGDCVHTKSTSEKITINETEVTLNKLNPYSYYEITIRLVASGRTGDEFITNITTKEDAPDAPPANVYIISEGEIQWDEIPCDLVNGKILHYEYLILNHSRSKRSTDEDSPEKVFVRNVTLGTVSDDNEITVRGVTAEGAGPWSKSLPVNLMPPPQNLSLITVSSSTLKIEWEPPLQRKDVVRYQLYYRLITSDASSKLSYVHRNTTEVTIELEGLIPSSTYSVNVSAVYANGESEPISKNFDIPSQDEETDNIKNFEYTSGSRDAHLKWEISAANVEIYQVTYKLIQHGDCLDTENTFETIKVNEPQVHLSNLNPNSSYGITIQTSSSGRLGEEFVTNLTTKEDVPDAPPSNVFIVRDGEIKWDKIPCESANGKISYYEYQVLNHSILRSSGLVLGRNISLGNVTVDDVIRVRGVTVKGPGPWSKELKLSSNGLNSKPPPQHLSRITVSPSTLEIEWQPPLERKDVEYYRLYYRLIASDVSNNLSYGNRNTTDVTIELEGLTPSSTYLVSVVAVYADGESEPISKNFDIPPHDEGRFAVTVPEPPPPRFIRSDDGQIIIYIYPVESKSDQKNVLTYQVIVEDAENEDIDRDLLDHYDIATTNNLLYYIAAELEVPPQGQEFAVGDDEEYGGYYNAKLSSWNRYRIYVRALGLGGVSLMSRSEDEPIEVGEQRSRTDCAGWTCHWFVVLLICIAVILVVIVVVLILCSQRRKQTGSLKISQSSDYLDSVANSKRNTFRNSVSSSKAVSETGTSTKRTSRHSVVTCQTATARCSQKSPDGGQKINLGHKL